MKQKLEKHPTEVQEGKRVCDLRRIDEIEETQKHLKEMEERAFILSSDFRRIMVDCRDSIEGLELWKNLITRKRPEL